MAPAVFSYVAQPVRAIRKQAPVPGGVSMWQRGAPLAAGEARVPARRWRELTCVYAQIPRDATVPLVPIAARSRSRPVRLANWLFVRGARCCGLRPTRVCAPRCVGRLRLVHRRVPTPRGRLHFGCKMGTHVCSAMPPCVPASSLARRCCADNQHAPPQRARVRARRATARRGHAATKAGAAADELHLKSGAWR